MCECELRGMALSMAIEASGVGANIKIVMEAAEKFFDFLKKSDCDACLGAEFADSVKISALS